jgi:hypothetical protein
MLIFQKSIDSNILFIFSILLSDFDFQYDVPYLLEILFAGEKPLTISEIIYGANTYPLFINIYINFF